MDPDSYMEKKVIKLSLEKDEDGNLERELSGSNLEEATGVFYSKNLAFMADQGNRVNYLRGYKERSYRYEWNSEKVVKTEDK